jgi:hypothetical protein
MSTETILLVTLAIEAIIMFGLGLAYTSWTSRQARAKENPSVNRLAHGDPPSRLAANTIHKNAA